MDEVLSKELLDQWVKRTKELSVYSLAVMAECESPDMAEGKRLLTDARDAVLQAVTDGEIVPLSDPGDVINRIAQSSSDAGVIEFRTHQLWLTWVDLCAYQEDLSDVGMTKIPASLDHLAWAALGIIVERLCYELCEELDNFARSYHWQYVGSDDLELSGGIYDADDAVEKRLWCDNGDLVERWTRTAPGGQWERQPS